MTKLRNVLLVILSVIIGYFVMVMGLFLSQDIAFGGIVIGETKLWEVLLAGVGAVFSGFAGGYVSGRISPLKSYLPQIILAIETIIEGTFLVIKGIAVNPIWFEFIAETGLIFGILGGGYLYLDRLKRKNLILNQVV